MKKRSTAGSGRVREQAGVDYGAAGKQKTSNVERRTLNVERKEGETQSGSVTKKRASKRTGRVEEEAGGEYGGGLKGKTSNVERRTLNVERRGEETQAGSVTKKRASKRTGRVEEEASGEYGGGLEGETSNVERRTSNVERRGEETQTAREARYDLEERLLEYAVRIIRLVDALPATKAGRHVADQLLRCGTSPLANHGELQGAESRKDFIHKLGICLKEIRETQRWLRLIHRVPLVSPPKIQPLLAETDALIRIFVASLRTAEKNR